MAVFKVNNHPTLELRIEDVRGEPGLGHSRVVFYANLFALEWEKEDKLCLVGLTGLLRVRSNGGQVYPVASLLAIPGITVPMERRAKRTNVCLHAEIAPERMGALENIRNGEDLTFELELEAQFTDTNGTHRVQEREIHTINQGTWVEVLRHSEHSDRMLLEIPRANLNASPDFSDAVRHLRDAQRHLQLGHYREAVGACRDVLEALSRVLGDQDDQDQEVQDLFANSRSMDKDARLRVLRRATKLVTHPARHADEVSAQFEWQRGDALALVTIVAALLQRMSS